MYDVLGRWSVAWRIFDSQFWGVPQRRKRIALVADYGGLSAPEILFERKGNTWDSKESRKEEKNTSRTIKKGSDSSVWHLQGNEIWRGNTTECKGNGFQPDISYTLNTTDRHATTVNAQELLSKDIVLIEMTSTKNTIVNDGICPTLTARMGTGGNQVNAIFNPNKAELIMRGIDVPKTEMKNKFVRKLIPLETERLQGLPDNWTDIGEWVDSKGKTHKESSDSARYKAVGNSIALPVFSYVLKRISAQYERPATMGSLFDGIGAFPLIWTRCNGTGTVLWASEIEEFPIAVCKKHFGDEDTGEQGDIRNYL